MTQPKIPADGSIWVGKINDLKYRVVGTVDGYVVFELNSGGTPRLEPIEQFLNYWTEVKPQFEIGKTYRYPGGYTYRVISKDEKSGDYVGCRVVNGTDSYTVWLFVRDISKTTVVTE